MNDKNDDILGRVFRDRLKEYKEQPDADLWSKIEASLQENNRKKKTATWKWIGTVAAAALLIGIIKFAVIEEEKLTPTRENITAKRCDTQTIKTPPAKNVINSKPVTIETNTTATIFTQNIKPKNIKANQITPIEIESETSADSTSAQPINTMEGNKKDVPTTQTVTVEKSPNTTTEKGSDNPLPLIADTSPEEWNIQRKGKTSKNNGLSLALAMGNSSSGVANTNNSTNYESSTSSNLKLEELASQYDGIKNNKLSEYVTDDVDYSIPIIVGFYIRKHLSDNWAIESGLCYTYLESNETQTAPNKPTVNKETNLNYLGIPVKAVYSFVKNNKFSVYASGGAMVEKCVYGKEKMIQSGNTNTLNIPEIQCSASGAIGINYQLISHLCLFVEPGVSYFFDNNSDVNTVRKDSPLSLEVQGGIRLVY